MKTPAGFASLCGRVSLVLCLFVAVAQPASAFDDPPMRVARLNYVAGQVSFQPGGETGWGWAAVNRPMTAGDSLWTGNSSRAEMHIESTAIRMSGQTSVSFLNLDDRTVQIQLNSETIRCARAQSLRRQRLPIPVPHSSERVSDSYNHRKAVAGALHCPRCAAHGPFSSPFDSIGFLRL